VVLGHVEPALVEPAPLEGRAPAAGLGQVDLAEGAADEAGIGQVAAVPVVTGEDPLHDLVHGAHAGTEVD
jgi:hypothetical protein